MVWGQTYTVTTVADPGWLLTSQSHSDGSITIANDETTITATAQRVGCHVDDGNDWVQCMVYVDDGDEWVLCQVYADDGVEWGLVY